MRALGILNSRAMRFIFWAAVIALAVNAFRIHQPTLKAAFLPSKVVPYTVVLQELALQRDGTAVPSFKLTQAMRGSRASEMTSSNPASPSSERILDFSTFHRGKNVHLFSPATEHHHVRPGQKPGRPLVARFRKQLFDFWIPTKV